MIFLFVPLIITGTILLWSLHPIIFAQSEENTIENSNTNSNLVNWTTYTNDDIGVSFDYPAGWDVSEKENRFDVTAADVLVIESIMS